MSAIQLPNPTLVLTEGDTNLEQLPFKGSVLCATTDNITLSGTQTIDDIVVAPSDRVLVKNQTDAKTNGVYIVSNEGWTRATDNDTSYKVTGTTTLAAKGTINGGQMFSCTTVDIVLDTTPLVFQSITGASGITSLNGLTASPQVFANGTTGSDVNFSSVGVIHTLNVPDAATGARGAVTTLTQNFGGYKSIILNDIVTNNVSNVLRICHNTSGVADIGLGTRLEFGIESSTSENATAGYLDCLYTNVTHATRDSEIATYIAINGTLTKRFNISKNGIRYINAVMPKTAAASITTPGAGDIAIFFDTDGNMYKKAETGAVSQVGGGVRSINTLTNSSQTIVADVIGTNFNISSVGSTHTINLPSAGIGVRGAVTTAEQYLEGLKKVYIKDATGNDVSNIMTLTHNCTGAVSNNIGVSLGMLCETSTTEDVAMSTITSRWTNATHASRTSNMSFNLYKSASPITPMEVTVEGPIIKNNIFTSMTQASVATPVAGNFAMFWDSADSKPKYKNSSSTVKVMLTSDDIIGGITSLNGITTATQTFSTGSTGTDFNISSAGTIHTFNIPTMNTGMTRGLMSNDSQTFNGTKTFNGRVNVSTGVDYGVYFNGTPGTTRIVYEPSGHVVMRVNDVSSFAVHSTAILSAVDFYIMAGTIQLPSATGTALAPQYTFYGNSNTGIFQQTSNTFGLTTNGTQRMLISDGDCQLTSTGIAYSTSTDATATIVLLKSHHIVRITNTGIVAVTLPLTTSYPGKEYILIKSASGGTVTITASGADHINDSVTTSIQLTAINDRIRLLSDGVGMWYTF